MTRYEELRQQTAAKIATFNVGDNIAFLLVDDAHCTETNGDALDWWEEGKIVALKGNKALVENGKGVFFVSLAIAKHL